MRDFISIPLYCVLGIAADSLDAVISTLTRKDSRRVVFPRTDIDGYSDKKILRLLSPQSKIERSVYRLTPHAVGKGTCVPAKDFPDPAEANVLNLVFEKTTIPVPRVHRVIKRPRGFFPPDHLIVMDYIEGSTLSDIWPSLSLWKKIGIAFTLRSYVRQLRHLKASAETPPGPPSALGLKPCVSSVFGPDCDLFGVGPFPSYAALSEYFNTRYQTMQDFLRVPEDDIRRTDLFDDSSPLVLSHQDLNPRNMILDKEGRLWLIDWQWAGYFPPWFEYAAMQKQAKNEEDHGKFKDRFWTLMIPFICGPYFRQERWLDSIALALRF